MLEIIYSFKTRNNCEELFSYTLALSLSFNKLASIFLVRAGPKVYRVGFLLKNSNLNLNLISNLINFGFLNQIETKTKLDKCRLYEYRVYNNLVFQTILFINLRFL